MCEESMGPIIDIINNYRQNEKTIINQLYFSVENHGPTIGGFRETIWREMFQQIIPKKFVIEQSVFIIDSEGKVSREVDLAIFDETYTPYIFQYGRIKFIPIEAVAVVVECKSSSIKKENLREWGEQIVELKTSVESYTRVAGRLIAAEANSTQTQTRPLRILCCLNTEDADIALENDEVLFDVVIRAPHQDAESLEIKFAENKESLQDWYLALNHAGKQNAEPASKTDVKIVDGASLKEITLDHYCVQDENGPVSLLSFNLQLNQLLMLINNPIPFPHMAYAKMFNGSSKGDQANE